MKQIILLGFLTCFFVTITPNMVLSQVGIGNNAPHTSAILDLSNTGAKGLLIPRITAAQKDTITSPASGLLLFQTDAQTGFYYNAGTPGLPNWSQVLTTESSPWISNGNHIYNQNSGNVGIATVSPMALFSVGANSEFQIDNTGNIRKINNLNYSFPSAHGSSGQVLSNDGNGNLSWADPTVQTSSLLSGNGSAALPLTIASPDLPNRRLITNGSNVVQWSINGAYLIGKSGGIANVTTTPWEILDFSTTQYGQNCITCKVVIRFYSPIDRTLYIRFPDDPNPVENVYDIPAGRSVTATVSALNAQFQYYSNTGGQLKYEFIGFFQ